MSRPFSLATRRLPFVPFVPFVPFAPFALLAFYNAGTRSRRRAKLTLPRPILPLPDQRSTSGAEFTIWGSRSRHLRPACLGVATLQVIFMPERPWAPPVAYSLAIGLFTWAIIDLGRHLFPSAAETGWPSGVAGPLLVAGGIAVGYLLGNALADLGCRTFGWYAGAPPLDPAVELRNSVLITVLAGVVGSYYF